MLLAKYVMVLLLLEKNTLKTSSSSFITPIAYTLEMTKGNKTMKEITPKTTNCLHTQKRTKGNKIVVEKESNNEKHGGLG